MDIEYFTKERIKFTKYFYENGCIPFQETIDLIEREQHPYVPVYDESGEPQFMSEWLQARDGIESIGLASLSMLSSSLQIYMNAWLDRFNVPSSKRKGKKGWFDAMKKAMRNCGVDFTTCKLDLDILEQLVLARNRVQHADNITSNTVTHLPKELARFPSPTFVDPSYLGSTNTWFSYPRVYVDQPKIDETASLIEGFCEWLEAEFVRLEQDRVRKKQKV